MEERLRELIRKTTSLTLGASAAGARVHLLPGSPADVPDNGEFRYLVLGPEAVSASGKPSRVACAFLDQTTSPDKPRVYRNAVLAVVPSREGLDAARTRVRGLLGWEDVAAQLGRQTVDPLRAERLRRLRGDAAREAPGVVRQAYGVVVTVNEESRVHAFKLPSSGEPLFAQVKGSSRARMTDTPVDAEALLPDGPYDLWREGEESRYANRLAESFARDPHLPKVLRPKLVAETVLDGVRRGLFVARLNRPDGTARTWWREEVDSAAAGDPALEIVLPEAAHLSRLNELLLEPGELPDLWEEASGSAEPELAVAKLLRYFAGGHSAEIPRAGWSEFASIPACDSGAVMAAVARAVERGVVWMTNPPATSWKEPVPAGSLNESATLRPPPRPLVPQDLAREALPGAWQDERTTGLALTQALSQQRSAALPWGLVRDGIEAALNARWLVLTEGSASPRGAYDRAAKVVLERPGKDIEARPKPRPRRAELDAVQLQDLAEAAPDLLTAVDGAELRFEVSVSVKGDLADEARDRANETLAEVSKDLSLARP